ncbi:hypothetical protein [Sinomicrobium weinanense]|uniref:ATP-grasp domain-containing protein n=1 Tax=Sinomicrobium weinanense TaxID=2842200 RepID=A0A926JNS2_9FLAO|nr:hypothetical protein [Sinomicrobium weinanense]MBC9794687.1 hypothetical protein [Sinomicrobium weinanense]MBU3124172.1 hypothetical protein [Sinomicrobium weinanense]
MKNDKHSLLYLTDLYYEAKGRNYYEEDIYITSRLKDDFEILICHPTQSKKHEQLTDAVIFRNTGSVMYYKKEYDDFVKRMNLSGTPVYNSLTGHGDMKGKQHLIDLTLAGYPVIPTIEKLLDMDRLPTTQKYILKLKNGADSIGMKLVTYGELQKSNLNNFVIQPFIDFKYEVSFYYIDKTFQYALYAPDKSKRWELKEYIPIAEDLEFSKKFIEWNTITHGIQRVDGCRLPNGELQLVELEDLNPYLSLNALNADKKEAFINAFKVSILKLINEV